MADKIRILALGGLDADGKNLYVVEINDQIFIVGCGLGYPDKSTPGVDYVIPDISYLKKRKDRVKGYILQDCQDTNLYGIPFIYNEIPAPIYTTSFAKEILYSFMKYIKRNDVELDIRYIDPNGETEIDGRKFSFFSITHSNPFTFGFAIDTTEGNIIFSGDFIIEYNKTRAFQTNINRLTEIVNKKPTYLLLADSANAGRKGFTSPSHRSDIHLKKAINDAEGRIYVAAYSQNMYILVEIIQNCLDSGRLICFFDKDTEFLFKILNKYNVIKISNDKVVSVDNLYLQADSNVMVVMTGPGELLYNKISMLALKDIPEPKLYIKESDTFILDCPPAPNFEVLSVAVLDELYKTDCKVSYITRKKVAKIHPSEDDLKLFISIVKPKFYIPIKGQFKDLMANANVALSMGIGLDYSSVFLLENGFAIDFQATRFSLEKVEDDPDVRVGPILVDGSGVGDVANEIIQERNALAKDGVIVMSCLVSVSERKILGGPDIQMRGYLFLKESEQILKKIQNLFIEIVESHLQNPNINFNQEACERELKDQCTKFTKKTTARTPIIEPRILVIN